MDRVRQLRLAVIGAGTIGSQAVRYLADHGAAPVVFERFDAPNGWGSHDGESRLLRTLPFRENAGGDREIIAASAAAWEEMEADSGAPILIRCGMLLIGQPDDHGLALAVPGQ